MSYEQAMRWARMHPTGTKQPMVFSTGSGFWPSASWLSEAWNPYVEACKQLGVEPFAMQVLYEFSLRGRILCGATAEYAAKYTKARRELGFDSP